MSARLGRFAFIESVLPYYTSEILINEETLWNSNVPFDGPSAFFQIDSPGRGTR